MLRYAFNRHKEGKTSKEVYQCLGNTFSNVNSHLRNYASRQAAGIFKLNNGKKVYFGKFLRLKRGLISKEEYKDSKNVGIFAEGESPYKGNYFFQIDVKNNKFIYKRACKEHYDLVIAEKLSDKRQHILSKLQLLMSEKKIPVTFRLKKDKVFITYD